MRDNPVFDMQVNPDDRNEINFQAFRLSPKTFDLYRVCEISLSFYQILALQYTPTKWKSIFWSIFLSLPTARWCSFIQKIILYHNPNSKLQRTVKCQIIGKRALPANGVTKISHGCDIFITSQFLFTMLFVTNH